MDQDVADHVAARGADTVSPFLTLQYLYALARTGHAWTLLESGDVRGARVEFEQARELDPTNLWAAEGLAITNTRRYRCRLKALVSLRIGYAVRG